MAKILEGQNLSKHFGRQRAVDAVNIQIHRGDIYGLIGRNGAGKTTLMRLIANLAKANRGELHFFDQDGKEVKSEEIKMANLIEYGGIYPSLNALDHVRLKAKSLGLKDKAQIEEVLKIVGLQNVGKKKVKSFSLGMKQRLGIAMALLGKPELLILDEPVNGLDPEGIVEIRKLIQFLNKEHGITFLLSSHLLDELAKLSTRFSIMDNGKIIEEIDQEAFHKKAKEFLRLKTSKMQEAIRVLDELGFHDRTMQADDLVDIVGKYEDTGRIVLALAQKEIPIEGFTVHQNSLEEYYLSIVQASKEVPYV